MTERYLTRVREDELELQLRDRATRLRAAVEAIRDVHGRLVLESLKVESLAHASERGHEIDEGSLGKAVRELARSINEELSRVVAELGDAHQDDASL